MNYDAMMIGSFLAPVLVQMLQVMELRDFLATKWHFQAVWVELHSQPEGMQQKKKGKE